MDAVCQHLSLDSAEMMTAPEVDKSTFESQECTWDAVESEWASRAANRAARASAS